MNGFLQVLFVVGEVQQVKKDRGCGHEEKQHEEQHVDGYSFHPPEGGGHRQVLPVHTHKDITKIMPAG